MAKSLRGLKALWLNTYILLKFLGLIALTGGVVLGEIICFYFLHRV